MTATDHIIADLCIVPMGNVNTAKYMIEINKILKDLNLNFKVHGFGTNLEGSYDEVMKGVRKCIDRVHEMGSKRIDTTVRFQVKKKFWYLIKIILSYN
ncbi:hypothetical protein Glove_112g45 [Diversispora epigaea]|uniref:Thiamine-binding protein domain-containing protein n=1 Tax=Diversispora epigaea TaxID=1348612 RepID=A0A397J5C1_9GLOM|nr:hypothetical protein Glove_112g45 [Diversispora epigaea]